jgi:hypothetical protein
MERYEPKSQFLLDVLAGLVPLSDREFGEWNLRRLIALTRDQDYSNRDWATFLLAQQEINTPAVRDAFLKATTDDDEVIRGEAIWGLARIAPDLARPLIQQALLVPPIHSNVFEAAALVADSSLLDALREWDWRSDDAYLDQLVTAAITACETGIPHPNYNSSS